MDGGLLSANATQLSVVVKLLVRDVELRSKRPQIDIDQLGNQVAPPPIS